MNDSTRPFSKGKYRFVGFRCRPFADILTGRLLFGYDVLGVPQR